jgi:hypothetical protein
MLHQTLLPQCLEEFVFAPITKNVIVRYMDGMMSVPSTSPEILANFDMEYSTASVKYNNLAMSAREEVEKVLAGDTSESNLRASFRRVLSVSIPPPVFYCPGTRSDSGLIFGVPLVDLETNQDNVPRVMRLCIEEVEKRGLDAKGIYSVSQSCMYWPWDSCVVSQTGYLFDKQVLQVR